MRASNLLFRVVLVGLLAAPAAARSVTPSDAEPMGDTEPMSDAELMKIVAVLDDGALLDRGGWENRWLPSAAAGSPLAMATVGDGVTISGPAQDSADRVLETEVAGYTRMALDRGGWENEFLPETALGNALALVAVGDGVTLISEEASEEEGAAGREPAAPAR